MCDPTPIGGRSESDDQRRNPDKNESHGSVVSGRFATVVLVDFAPMTSGDESWGAKESQVRSHSWGKTRRQCLRVRRREQQWNPDRDKKESTTS